MGVNLINTCWVNTTIIIIQYYYYYTITTYYCFQFLNLSTKDKDPRPNLINEDTIQLQEGLDEALVERNEIMIKWVTHNVLLFYILLQSITAYIGGQDEH